MTAAGVIMLLRFQTTPGGVQAVGAAGSTGSGPSGSAPPGGTVTTTTPSTSGGFDDEGGFDRGFDGGFGNEVPTTVPDPNATTAAGANDGTFTGAVIQTRFGPVQVQAVISGGSLSDVVELQTPNDRERSIEINSQAGPILHDEAIQAQSAELDQVSGATITWAAYEQSLQAALDAAHK
jgi:uncharacterized protein with FMN-binding domain